MLGWVTSALWTVRASGLESPASRAISFPAPPLTLNSPLLSLPLAALLLAPAGANDDPIEAVSRVSGPDNPNLVEGSFRIERGGQQSLWVPPGEALEFRVEVDLGVLGEATVGTVTMSSGVEPFVSGLPMPGQKLDEDGELAAWLKIQAKGGHLGYELDHSITTRFLPQAWPSQVNSEVQSGSENRKREVKVGVKDGSWVSTYRSNGHCKDCKRREHYVKASLPWNDDYHCSGCKRAEHRVWGTAREHPVPEQTIDILGAVYLARTLVRDDLEELNLPMLQKEDLWDIKVKRGKLADIRVGAGVFRCRQVRLEVTPADGQDVSKKEFSGLFGIKGALQIWLHEGTGVPVLIEGDVPLGSLLDLHVSVRLAKSRGTPEAFKRVR